MKQLAYLHTSEKYLSPFRFLFTFIEIFSFTDNNLDG